MSQPNLTPPDPHQDAAFAAANATFGQSMKALREAVERITPWLVEVGNWLFAGLIGFILIVIAALLTVGPVDGAIRVSTAALALALPLNLAGLFLLRMAQDLRRIGFTGEWTQAFQRAGLPVRDRTAAPDTLEARQARRVDIILLYCFGILVLSVLLTLTGMIAALWHMGWWIAVAFFVIAVISLGVVIAALMTARPPESPAEKEQQRRYWEEMMRRASDQPKQTEGE